jgi:hypothetical protein
MLESVIMKKVEQVTLFPIVLALSVSLCQAETKTITRVEENHPAINYSGSWVVDSQGVNSAGRAIVLNQSGARASLAFTGTAIAWIGAGGFDRGVARVYLDGTANTIDTYSAIRNDQQMLFVGKGLSQGVHTLVIEVTPMKNLNAAGSGISIDAFEISNGGLVSGNAVANPGYIEQNDPAVTYSGAWYLNSSARASAGSAVLAVDPGSTATVLFNGTGILWIGYRDPWSGLAEVYLDGVLVTTLDTWYAPFGDGSVNDIFQRPIWQVTGLENGVHMLSIKVLGQMGPNSAGPWIWVDAFNVFGPPVGVPGARP